LHAGFDDKQIRVVAYSQRELVVFGLIERRVYRGAVAVLVIVGFSPRAGIGDVNVAVRNRNRAAGGDAIAVAAPKNGDRAVSNHAIARRETRRGTVHPDRAANTVA